MNATTLAQRAAPRFTLRPLLVFDALTCLLTGLLLVTAADPLAGLLGLPAGLLFYAGVVLFPCAVVMAIAARSLARSLVWMVILGNFAWVIGSLYVALAFDTTAPGFAFMLAQAAVVGVLAVLEWRAR